MRVLLDRLERVPAWRLWYPDLETAETQVAEVWQALEDQQAKPSPSTLPALS